MGISDKITCDRCGAQYPKRIDSEKHQVNWFITTDNKVLCPICDAIDLGDEEALQAIDKALELNPDDFSAWNSKGQVLDNLGRHEEALQAIDKALELNLDRHEEALQAIDKALELNPDDSDLWNSKGLALVNLDRHEEALQAILKALELKPDDSYAWYNIGTVFNNLGHYEEAQIAFRKSSELNMKPK